MVAAQQVRAGEGLPAARAVEGARAAHVGEASVVAVREEHRDLGRRGRAQQQQQRRAQHRATQGRHGSSSRGRDSRRPQQQATESSGAVSGSGRERATRCERLWRPQQPVARRAPLLAPVPGCRSLCQPLLEKAVQAVRQPARGSCSRQPIRIRQWRDVMLAARPASLCTDSQSHRRCCPALPRAAALCSRSAAALCPRHNLLHSEATRRLCAAQTSAEISRQPTDKSQTGASHRLLVSQTASHRSDSVPLPASALHSRQAAD